ncbi:MAG: glycosyltransferase family 4 protein [Ignavibacterium sp.]
MEMRTIKVSKSLIQLGHDLTLLCYPNSSLNIEAKQSSLKTITLPFSNGIHIYLIQKLKKFILKEKFDIIHLHYSRDLRFVIPAISQIKPKIPVVLTKRIGSYINKKNFIHKYLYSKVDLITTISEVIKKNVIETCPINPDKVEVIYNGINIHEFQNASKYREKIRHELNINEDEILIGMFGRFSPGKGYEEFLKAVKIISDKKLNTKFIIVGKSSYGEENYANKIYNLAKELELNDIVKFLGYRKDIPELMSAIDILAVPSYAEAFGNVAIEGMAAAKPVVATNTDGLVEIVINGETGLQIPPQNFKALSEALIKLINDVQLRKSFGEAGLKRVINVFNEDIQMKKLENRFLELIKKNSK